MDTWSPSRRRIGGTPRRVAARSSPRFWSGLDHPVRIIKPVEADAEDGDGKRHHHYEENDSAYDPNHQPPSFQWPRFLEPERPDRNREHRQATQLDTKQRVRRQKGLDDIETRYRDEDDDDREQEGTVKPASKSRGKRRAPMG